MNKKNYKSELDTPCLIMDMELLENNLKNMQQSIDAAGKSIRPHAKTHKCSELARLQVKSGAIGICAAKISEADKLVQSGLNNILITSPVATEHKINKLAEIVKVCPSLIIVVDNSRNAEMLNQKMLKENLYLNVFLDLDAGLGRTGVNHSDALTLAEQINKSSHLNLKGVQAYAGHIQHITSFEARKQGSLECMKACAEVFHSIKSRFPECAKLSGCGTGTHNIDISIPEITELQVGSYVCMDTEYINIGSADNNNKFSIFPPPLRLLTTVISANQKDFVTVDAGLKAVYQNGGFPELIDSDLKYDWFGDEYGKITAADKYTKLPEVGTVLEMIVPHCDPTVNLFDKYILVKNGQVTGSWDIDLRGCCQ